MDVELTGIHEYEGVVKSDGPLLLLDEFVVQSGCGRRLYFFLRIENVLVAIQRHYEIQKKCDLR